MVKFTFKPKTSSSNKDEEQVMVEKKEWNWLERLLTSELFGICFESDHQESKAHTLNMFCIECKQVGCQQCFSSKIHYLHNVLQIRRYVYQSVINLQDMQNYFNCAKIQTYLTNKQRVVLLNPSDTRNSQAKPHRNGKICEVCKKAMQDSNRFCSIACKLQVLTRNIAEKECNPLFSVQNQDPTTHSDSAAQESEPSPGQDEYSNQDECHEEAGKESDKDLYCDYYLTHNSLRPRHRSFKRKGVPHRAPF